MARVGKSKHKKRTISQEHLVKMQEGRRKAAVKRKQIAMLKDSHIVCHESVTPIGKMLHDLRRMK